MAFVMPPVEVGDIVYYYPTGRADSAPAPAVVTKAGRGNISLSVFTEDRTQFQVPSGVMHISDPRISNAYNDAGGWDYTPARKKLDEAMLLLKLLEEDRLPQKTTKAA